MAPGFLHKRMTQDALLAFGLADDQIQNILEAVAEVDYVFGHPDHSNHRVERYQRRFEEFGGTRCIFRGAEWQAEQQLHMAQQLWGMGEKKEAKRKLGYTIHFIHDALCPEHIFPFKEGRRLDGAHFNYEAYIGLKYRFSRWPFFVRNAPAYQIATPKALCQEVAEAAYWVSCFPCSYIRQDGQRVQDPRTGKTLFGGVRMSDQDTGRWMERAASLVKGSVLLVLLSD